MLVHRVVGPAEGAVNEPVALVTSPTGAVAGEARVEPPTVGSHVGSVTSFSLVSGSSPALVAGVSVAASASVVVVGEGRAVRAVGSSLLAGLPGEVLAGGGRCGVLPSLDPQDRVRVSWMDSVKTNYMV